MNRTRARIGLEGAAWIAILLVWSSSARAATQAARDVSIAAGPMGAALADLGRQTGADIIFDEKLVRGLRARRLSGRISADAGLAQLLDGTALAYRRTADGAYVLFERPRPPPMQVNVSRYYSGDGAVAEILVIGHRTQNADIRRTQNDIQPYDITLPEDISEAHPDDVNDYARSRLTQNQEQGSPAQDTSGRSAGSVRSEINLLRLGPDRTLVLVDGRRLPGMPVGDNGIAQSDINPLPLGAVARIETLTSSASGIYGPDAIGGVVNFVLRRDFGAPEIHVEGGATTLGDGGRLRIELGAGGSPDDGRTNVMIDLSMTRADALLTGERPFADIERSRWYANDPDGAVNLLLTGAAINVVGLGPLQLIPSLGGTPLNATRTFLPLNFTGSAAAQAAALVANAGNANTSLPPGHGGASDTLVSSTLSGAGLFNLRHRFNSDVEAFVDVLWLHDAGRQAAGAAPSPDLTLPGPTDPFTQPVIFLFPTQDAATIRSNVSDTYRASSGVIFKLPSDWRATADYALSQTRVTSRVDSVTTGQDYELALESGLAPPGLPALNPLGDYATLQRAVDAYLTPFTSITRQTATLNDVNLKLAGPVGRLPGGPLTLELSGEGYIQRLQQTSFSVLDQGFQTPALEQQVGSAMFELRAPILPTGVSFVPLRGLELQAAARYDHVTSRFPSSFSPLPSSLTTHLSASDDVETFTLGARSRPEPWLLLRGSVATGQLPPALSELPFDTLPVSGDLFNLPDPKRGGRDVGSEGDYTILAGGSPTLKPELATTTSFGLVLNPDGVPGPRLSLDVSRLDGRRVATMEFSGDVAYFLAHQTQLPGRIIRAPLTAADAAQGFTGGAITEIDTRAFNGGSSEVEWLTSRLDWSLPRKVLSGRVRVAGEATLEPVDRVRPAPGQPWIEQTGFIDGPLAWKANFGIDWRRGDLRVGGAVQLYSGYHITYSDPQALGLNPENEKLQGGDAVSSQTYVDLSAGKTFHIREMGAFETLQAEFAIQNIFDVRPPIVAIQGAPGYSLYGDPRGRRVTLALSSRF